MFLVSRVDLVAPLPRLLIQILPTGEGAPRQEVSLNEPETSFYPCRTVGVAAFMRHKLETESLREGGHLRYRNHFAAGAAQHDHMRVIDHDLFGRAGEIA